MYLLIYPSYLKLLISGPGTHETCGSGGLSEDAINISRLQNYCW